MGCLPCFAIEIVALRNEKGSYNLTTKITVTTLIVALRNEKGSYNCRRCGCDWAIIVALRNEKGSYNQNHRSN